MTEKLYFTNKEAAQILDCTRQWLDYHGGKFKRKRRGRFTVEQINELIEIRKQLAETKKRVVKTLLERARSYENLDVQGQVEKAMMASKRLELIRNAKNFCLIIKKEFPEMAI